MHRGGRWGSYIRYDDTQEPPRVNRQLLGRVLGYARPYRGTLALMVVAIVADSLVGLLPPLLYRELIDTVLPGRDLSRLKYSRSNRSRSNFSFPSKAVPGPVRL